ncbi:MAG: ATP synthase F1 subunit gamma [Chloroflexi bacterium]|nr:ATP synthase F1 subunit gamma [Chloroflexota bacterium]
MPSAREMRSRIRSVGNISQVTRALQAVSASRARKAEQAVAATRPYAAKAWQVLQHLSNQPGRAYLHPLLTERAAASRILVVLVTGDRGLCGAYNINVVRYALEHFARAKAEVSYVVIGRKGRDMLVRRRGELRAEFTGLPAEPVFADVSAIGRLAVDDFLTGRFDQVYLVYTDYVNLLKQVPRTVKLLPLELETGGGRVADFAGHAHQGSAYIYEPGETELLDQIVPRFTALQVFQAILESQASEHAARMVAMRNATENAKELVAALRLDYNKARQQSITNDMLDIAGGAEALAQAGGA